MSQALPASSYLPSASRGQAHSTGGASLHLPDSLSFWSCTCISSNKPLAHSILSWQLLSRKLKLTEVCRGGHPLSALCFILVTSFYYSSRLGRRQVSSHCPEEETKCDGDEQLAPLSRGWSRRGYIVSPKVKCLFCAFSQFTRLCPPTPRSATSAEPVSSNF